MQCTNDLDADEGSMYYIRLISPEFVKFTISGIISIILGITVYYFFADVIGIKAVLVAIVWQPTQFVLKYFVNKKWVFKK